MPNFPYSSTLIMSLNGQAYFDCSTNLSSLFTGQSPFTVEAWVKFNDLNGSQTIVGTYSTGDISQGIVGLMLNNGSIINASGQLMTLDVLQDNTWYFVALTFDGATLSLYLDGVLQSSTTSFNTTGTNNLMIGAAQSSSGVINKLNGSLQSVVIWPESRVDQIMKDMNLPLTPLSGVSAWFSFMQFTPADISGNQVPAQLSGSLTPTVDTPCLQVPGSSGEGFGDCGAPDSLNFIGSQPFTLEAWVYPERNTGGAIISKITSNSQPMYQLAINGSGNLIFAAYQSTKGTSITMLSTTQVPVNEWSHVAGTYDGNNTLTLYFNGQPITASPFILGGAPTNPTQHTLVGSGFNRLSRICPDLEHQPLRPGN